jgi:hypothetical protein
MVCRCAEAPIALERGEVLREPEVTPEAIAAYREGAIGVLRDR